MKDFNVNKRGLFGRHCVIPPISEVEPLERVVIEFMRTDGEVFPEMFHDVPKKEKRNRHVDPVTDNPEYYALLDEVKRLKRLKGMKKWLRFENSAEYLAYLELSESYELKEFRDFDRFVNSYDFQELQDRKGKAFKDSLHYKFWQRHRRDKKSRRYKYYYKIKDSYELEQYHEFIHTPEYRRLKQLEKRLRLLECCEEPQPEPEYMPDIDQKFVNRRKVRKLVQKELEKWQLTFEDDFNMLCLDKNKWMTGYYWGKKLLKDDYVLDGENQYFTDRNIEIRANCMHIVTRRENITGNVWLQEFGFIRRDFRFSSALVHTAASFRQKFGLFKAKIRMTHVPPVYHAFWLSSGKISPEIDIMKYKSRQNNELFMNLYWGPGQDHHDTSRIYGLDFNNEFYIYSLEWTPEKLIWKINDVTVKIQTINIPDEEMFIVLSSGLTGDVDESALPVSMSVDWVRCYRLKS